jgi:uncharacterized protein (DUF58 family)
VLTARGKDYLKATAITILITSIAGPAIAGALTLALAAMAAISLLLLRSRIGASGISVEPLRLRAFKRETRSAVLRVGSLGSSFARVSSVSISNPFGLGCEVGKLERGAAELAFTPYYAGSFTGIKAAVRVMDALGLFGETREVDLGLVVEALPRSLLMADTPMLLSLAVQGEVPTGGRGSGQEMYSIESYAPGSDARDVMWKRMARSGDETMLVRVREASAKAAIGMLLRLGSRTAEEQVRRVDLASEAIAQLGKKLVSMGVTVELACSRKGGLSSAEASNVTELAAAIIGVWSAKPESTDVDEAMARADLLVLDSEELEDESAARFLGQKPLLLLWDAAGRPSSGGKTFVFTGSEDLTPLAEVLLET